MRLELNLDNHLIYSCLSSRCIKKKGSQINESLLKKNCYEKVRSLTPNYIINIVNII